jgi:hypothetical protein
MHKQRQNRPSSGAKAIAIDLREKFARYRLFLLLSLLTGLALDVILHIFAH